MIQNSKDADMIAGIEGYGYLNENIDNRMFPLNMIIPKPRRKIDAIRTQNTYNKMGIHTCIIPQR